jgi:hypothetical protein
MPPSGPGQLRFLELLLRHVKTPAPAAFVDTGCVPAVEHHRDCGRPGRHSAGILYLARLERPVRVHSPSSNPVIGRKVWLRWRSFAPAVPFDPALSEVSQRFRFSHGAELIGGLILDLNRRRNFL